MWFYALGREGVGRIGSLQLLMPVLTLVAATLFLGEIITPLLCAISLAVVVGTYVAHRHAP